VGAATQNAKRPRTDDDVLPVAKKARPTAPSEGGATGDDAVILIDGPSGGAIVIDDDD